MLIKLSSVINDHIQSMAANEDVYPLTLVDYCALGDGGTVSHQSSPAARCADVSRLPVPLATYGLAP